MAKTVLQEVEIQDIRRTALEVVDGEEFQTLNKKRIDALAFLLMLCAPDVTERGRRTLRPSDITDEEMHGFRDQAAAVLAHQMRHGVV